jgi:hypothetical protein
MTLLRLLDLLAAIPSDCADLPVYFDFGEGSVHVRVVVVNPPNPGDGGEPCVTLSNGLEGIPTPALLLMERRRLPGS